MGWGSPVSNRRGGQRAGGSHGRNGAGTHEDRRYQGLLARLKDLERVVCQITEASTLEIDPETAARIAEIRARRAEALQLDRLLACDLEAVLAAVRAKHADLPRQKFVEWGRQGAVIANARYTPEERRAQLARGYAEWQAKTTAEERQAIARKGGLARGLRLRGA